MITCNKCGHQNKAAAKFCEECGSPLQNIKSPQISSAKKNQNYLTVFFVVILLSVMVVFYYNYQLVNPGNSSEHEHDHGQTEQSASSSVEKTPLMNMEMLAAKKALIEKTPDNIDVIVDLANYLFDHKQFSEALKYYQNALKLNNNLPDIHVEIGVCYFNLKDLKSAEDYFKKAVELNPNHTKALFNLGVVYFNLEEKDKAISTWKDLIQKAPDSDEAMQAKNFFNK